MPACPVLVTIPEKSFFKIGEVAKILDVKAHIVRYWESEFRAVRPSKTRSGQRLFRRKDIELLLLIRALVHEQRFTVEGARRQLRELADAGIQPIEILEKVEQGVPLAAVLSGSTRAADAGDQPAAPIETPIAEPVRTEPSATEVALRERLEAAETRVGLMVAENASLRSTLELLQARAARGVSPAATRSRFEALLRVVGPAD